MSICAELLVEFASKPDERRIRQLQHHIFSATNGEHLFDLSPRRLFLHPVAVERTETGIRSLADRWAPQADIDALRNNSLVYRIDITPQRAYSENYRQGPILDFVSIFMALLSQPDVAGVYNGSDEWDYLPRLGESEIFQLLRDFGQHGRDTRLSLDSPNETPPECPFCAIPMSRTTRGGDRSRSDYSIRFACTGCETAAIVQGIDALAFEAGEAYTLTEFHDHRRNVVLASDATTVLREWLPERTRRWWTIFCGMKLNQAEGKGAIDVLESLKDYFLLNKDDLAIEIADELVRMRGRGL